MCITCGSNIYAFLTSVKSTLNLLKGAWSPKLTYTFYPFCDNFYDIIYDNFDSNISAQRSVNTEKFTFEVDNLRKRRRKRAAMMICGDVMSLAYRRHELIFMTSI